MAYNVSEEKLLELMVSDPSYCLFYHRERVRQLLPSLAEAYLLIGRLQKELKANLQDQEGILVTKDLNEVRPDRPDYRLPGDN